MSDLIERLRRIESNQVSDFFATNWQRNPDGPEAADEIERLRRANEALQAEVVRRAMERADIRRELAEAKRILRYVRVQDCDVIACRDIDALLAPDQPELAVELQAKGYQPKPVGSK